MPYDRQLLLAGSKRNEILELWEVQRYGSDSYGDADYVSIYGMPPPEWYSRGVRLLGRTAVECTRDDLGSAIGLDTAAVAAQASNVAATLVIDPFVGSGNTLYWLLHHLPRASGLGFELDPTVFQLTRQNLALLSLPIDVRNVDLARQDQSPPRSLSRVRACDSASSSSCGWASAGSTTFGRRRR